MPVTKRGESWQAQVNFKGERWRRNWPTKPEALAWEAESKARLHRGETPEMEVTRRSNTDLPETLGELLDYVHTHHWVTMPSGIKTLIAATSIVRTIGPTMPIRKVKYDDEGTTYLKQILGAKVFEYRDRHGTPSWRCGASRSDGVVLVDAVLRPRRTDPHGVPSPLALPADAGPGDGPHPLGHPGWGRVRFDVG